MDKQNLRKELIKARLLLDDNEYLNKSNLIIESLINNLAFQQAKTIGIYVSYNNEVETQVLINDLFNQKNVCVPKVKGKTMDFHQIASFDELESNKMGILEPINDNLVDPQDIDLLIVPIVGYDKNHNRLGYGGGYYDRYLENYHNDVIGIAFKLQEVEKIETNKYDKKINIIINEEEII